MRSEWSRRFLQELRLELDARCNHGVVVFNHDKNCGEEGPDNSVTVRGKTVWLTAMLWEDGKRPPLPPEKADIMDKLLTAFYIHIMVEKNKFQGVWISREEGKPAFWGSLGEAVRYLTTFFDLDTADLEY